MINSGSMAINAIAIRIEVVGSFATSAPGAAGALSFDLPAEYAAAFSGWERAYSEPDAAAGI